MNNNTLVIGLTGFASAGKDEAAKALVARLGFTRIAFADPLREMLYALNPVVVFEGGYYGTTLFPGGGMDFWANSGDRVQDLVNAYGWEDAKKVPEVRTLLQRLGTEAGRNILGDNIWVETALKEAARFPAVVFTDVRFPNEARAVRRLGGKVIRVVRPGVSAVNNHISDAGQAEIEVDYVLHNDGTVEDLHDVIVGYAYKEELAYA